MRSNTSSAATSGCLANVSAQRPEHEPDMSAPGHRRLRHLEGAIARIRAEQIAHLVAHLDGPDRLATQDLAECLDVSLDTAATLLEVAAGLAHEPVLFAALAHGDVTLDRAGAILRLQRRSAGLADAAWTRRVDDLDSDAPDATPASLV